MPADLNRLTEGWLELESDPGLFTLLLEDFGVRGVQVEEVYDLQKTIEGPVYGFIFLFKWIEERRSRRKLTAEESFIEDEETINSIFFAQQMVPNSCATHALLSVLLNCQKIFLGPTLLRLKEHTANMSPENKGYAIGNTPELARAHNSHAKPEPRHLHEKSHGITTGRTVETFHFVSYVPISGRLFELDGLKPYPIDHGPCAEDDWTDKFRRVMTERLGTATGGEPYHDVRFNLMAVVPDRRIAYEQKLRTLKTNRQIVLEALQQLVKLTHPELTSDDHAAYVAAMNNHSETLDEENSHESSITKKSGSSQGRASPYPKLPPALDNHNYAKSPLMEGLKTDSSSSQHHYEDYSGSEYSDEEIRAKPVKLLGTALDDFKDTSDSNTDSHLSASTEDKKSIVTSEESENAGQLSMAPLTINTSSDFMKPLSIQTKFQPSPTPSASSTDTASEVGSAFNSPVQSYNFLQVSPNSGRPARLNDDDVHDIKKFVVIRMTSSADNKTVEKNDCEIVYEKTCDDIEKENNCDKKEKLEEPPVKKMCFDDSNSEVSSDSSELRKIYDNEKINLKKGDAEKTQKNYSNENDCESQKKEQDKHENKNKNNCSARHPDLIEPHRFAPKDLLALLKTVETEIAICESNLHDEIEKRKKYKIDDCRRTHNYDQFICTFLSMLAEQGKLADLVEQQLLVHKRQGGKVGRLHKARKPEKRRRSRPKKRK